MTTDDLVHMAYTGTLDCGCIVSAVVDDPEHKRDTARTVAAMVRDGERVDRRPVEEVRGDPAFLRNCGAAGHKRNRNR